MVRTNASYAMLILCVCLGEIVSAEDAIEIGAHRQLFVDDFLIEKLEGTQLRLHSPTPQEVVIVHDEQWEGNACGHRTVFQDGHLYRMYYRGANLDISGERIRFSQPNYICYAESKDGIRWTKPKLGLVEFKGSKQNNIILECSRTTAANGSFAVFKDGNPNCQPDARYKAIAARYDKKRGLYSYKSPDGIRWSLMSDKPLISQGAFDSQNLAFWDAVLGEYRVFYRVFRNGRDVMTARSKDFLHWTDLQPLKYRPGRITELYTNQVIPYYRAPHLLLGFPTRYVARGVSLTSLNERLARIKNNKRLGTDYTDGGFMASRDGTEFRMWSEAFVRPGLEQKRRWVYGDNYQNWGLVETKSNVSGAPNELSMYLDEGYYRGKGNRARRYTLRLDGFVSVEAALSGGEFFTKPLTFDGSRLEINFSTSVAGSVRVEIQDADGKRIDGFSLADCPEVFGDSLARVLQWKGGSDVSKLAGKPIRLRFVMRDANVYAFRFE